jgi:hypothetical protein
MLPPWGATAGDVDAAAAPRLRALLYACVLELSRLAFGAAPRRIQIQEFRKTKGRDNISRSFSRLHGVPQRRFAGRRRFYRGMADCINKYSAMRGRIGFTECKVLPVFHLHFIILSASPQYARTCIRQPSHLPTDVL